MTNFTLEDLETIVAARAGSTDGSSYTATLARKGAAHTAKKLGEQVNQARHRVNHLKSMLQKRRLQRGMQQVDQAGGADVAETEDEREIRHEIEEQKHSYHENFAELKRLKHEIEHTQGLLESSRHRLQRDFEAWWSQRHVSPAASPQHSRPSSTTSSAGRPRRSPKPKHKATVETAYRFDTAPEREEPTFVSTGNAQADADVAAFYRLRDEMLKRHSTS